MNAAVTFTNCALGRMAWKKFPIYVLGQFLGSFLAAATTYLIFYGEHSSWIVYLQPLFLKHSQDSILVSCSGIKKTPNKQTNKHRPPPKKNPKP